MALIFTTSLFAGLDDISRTTAIVHTKERKFGTAVFVKETDDKYYLLTAGHLIVKEVETEDGKKKKEQLKNVDILLTYEGHHSLPMKADVEWAVLNNDFEKNQYYDVAYLSIDREPIDLFYGPPTISEFGESFKISDSIYTFGCPSLFWCFGTKGRIFGIKKKTRCFFIYPHPVGGQSGSGIFNEENKLLGIVIADNGAVFDINGIKHYIKYFEEKKKNDADNDSTDSN